MTAHNTRRQITLLELAAYRLGRDARTGADFDEAGAPILAGCETCGATVAAYNAHPSRSGYIRCADCIGEHGWTDVALADHDIFGSPDRTTCASRPAPRGEGRRLWRRAYCHLGTASGAQGLLNCRGTTSIREGDAMRAMVLTAAFLVGLGFAAALAIGQGSSTDRALFGRLSGQNEISDEGERGAGDRNARGSATAIVDGGQLCFGLTVKNTDTPQAAHIHRGGRDANGPVVVQLEAPEEGDPGSASGCVSIRNSVARAILSNPSRYYWNVHTEEFPDGALRGQLFRG